MSEQRLPGRSLATRRAIVDIIRPAVSGSYGVLGFAEPRLWRRMLRVAGTPEPGIRVSLHDGIAIDLHLSVAYGLPVAEVARQADSAVRYAVRRALGREVQRLTVHVGGLRFQPVPPRPFQVPPNAAAAASVGEPGSAATPGGSAVETQGNGREPARPTAPRQSSARRRRWRRRPGGATTAPIPAPGEPSTGSSG
jgi:uncharacterized alkaline shock family protein YloU